ncbi:MULTISPECIES: RNA repair transcriptional activator RtcR [unclassified Chelatococcus]|uniref:RNA repair transcriptional activator RtcR n=1 Tax=unclassified Chelatococcus TaxID=2638111 RepID=UPI001BCACF23|nr:MULTISPECIES: RNA repair transcriptional activator RtcR [unclassified Chelatococcus]CAH1673024.1 DNA-binding transcriptional activator RtcR [Hyphomicrobiales bacterium]MBS7738876.1 RNA repair transcriptional activator RtcR [Chelatococcus sp. HY11]MBX3547028.1 RNA repair transcriptional activator RtcR [Chelatococcus sp.]MCO5076596.1 RNA repair transcriptional activator RtcR [Chelatococcus sp.]CAH1674737.1 DNA-binding transcriptional activator RtcR [Hyphomicrobiales bacterium]
MRRRIAISVLGTTLDSGGRKDRWKRWRPTVALCQQPGLFIDRLELIHGAKHLPLAIQVTRDIEQISPATEVKLHEITLRDPWDFSEVYTSMRDFAHGYSFDPEREDYLVNITTGTHVAQICWFLLTEARYIPGRLVQLSPPRKTEDPGDYSGTHSIIDLDLSRYDAIATRFAAERAEATSFLKSGIATRNATFNEMIDQIEKVAIRSRAPVLLTGPTGAGKSQLARRIYELKQAQRQVSGAFVEVNCATLRGDQAMSTLFGHVKGAFTGAQTARAGLMKAADKGVLFLDEIGELGLDEQAMCLRAIEEKRFLPVGADSDTASDFQLLAGTNRDLSVSVREGRFREDLFARLNLWTFQLPALKDRREDIEPNLDFELRRFSEREGLNATFNKEARALYLTFAMAPEAAWRANFRDLSASVTRMATLAPQARINEETVRQEIGRLRWLWSSASDSGTPEDLLIGVLGAERAAGLDLFDRAQLAAVIAACRGHSSISAAGRQLFAVSRLQKSTGNDADRLRKYLLKFGLTFEDVSRPA